MPTALAELKNIAIINTLRSCQLLTGLPQPDLENIAAERCIAAEPRRIAADAERAEFARDQGERTR